MDQTCAGFPRSAIRAGVPGSTAHTGLGVWRLRARGSRARWLCYERRRVDVTRGLRWRVHLPRLLQSTHGQLHDGNTCGTCGSDAWQRQCCCCRSSRRWQSDCLLSYSVSWAKASKSCPHASGRAHAVKNKLPKGVRSGCLLFPNFASIDRRQLTFE